MSVEPTGRVHRVSEEALRAFLHDAFEAAGLRASDARLVVDSLVSSDLRGTHSHGMIRAPFLIERLLQGGANRAPNMTILQDGPATAVLDGDRALGAITAARAMELAITKASQQGIGMVCARNSDFVGTCAHYAMMALPHDMIGIAWTNGFPGMAAWGARNNSIGNNPIAFAAPSLRHGPIVLDMALSVAAGGRIRIAAKSGERIPMDWMLDRDGQPTDDPAALGVGGALLPLGYKGFGLAVFGEILCGVLAGARVLHEIPAWHEDTAHGVGNGHLHIAIDIARFVEPQGFKQRIDELVSMLKSAPRQSHVEEILMPGERALRAYEMNRREGVPLSEAVVSDLRSLAVRLHVPAPDWLSADRTLAH